MVSKGWQTPHSRRAVASRGSPFGLAGGPAAFGAGRVWGAGRAGA